MEQLESVRNELSKHFSEEDVSLIQAIIDNVSFSKEAKQRKRGETPSWLELGQGIHIHPQYTIILYIIKYHSMHALATSRNVV